MKREQEYVAVSEARPHRNNPRHTEEDEEEINRDEERFLSGWGVIQESSTESDDERNGREEATCQCFSFEC